MDVDNIYYIICQHDTLVADGVAETICFATFVPSSCAAGDGNVLTNNTINIVTCPGFDD
jgi:hypothetical protein